MHEQDDAITKVRGTIGNTVFSVPVSASQFKTLIKVLESHKEGTAIAMLLGCATLGLSLYLKRKDEKAKYEMQGMIMGKKPTRQENRDFSLFFQENWGKIVRYSRYKLKGLEVEEAEEVAAEVFLKFYVYWPQYKFADEAEREKILSRMLHNKLVNYYRDRGRHEAILKDIAKDQPVSELIESEDTDQPKRDELLKRVKILHPVDQLLVALKLAGLDNKSIGVTLGLKEGGVKMRYNRIIKELKGVK